MDPIQSSNLQQAYQGVMPSAPKQEEVQEAQAAVQATQQSAQVQGSENRPSDFGERVGSQINIYA